MTLLVVTADDFGVAVEVNEAVELAHTDGILTAASLMVTGAAAADAVARAHRLPKLGVGLHLDLSEGRPVTPAAEVPDLVDAAGRFRRGRGSTGLRVATDPRVRRQLRREIDAQFAAFRSTGLRIDHVNAHEHMHLHPVLAGMVLDAAARYGASALRAPVEPGVPQGSGWLAAPFARALRQRARRRGMLVPDRVFGLKASGRMTGDEIFRAIDRIAGGINELYLHPATRDDFPGHAPGYRYRAELDGLLARESREAVRRSGARLGCFADFASDR